MTNYDGLHDTPQRPSYPVYERERSPWGRIIAAVAIIAAVFFGLYMIGSSVDDSGLRDGEATTGVVSEPAQPAPTVTD